MPKSKIVHHGASAPAGGLSAEAARPFPPELHYLRFMGWGNVPLARGCGSGSNSRMNPAQITIQESPGETESLAVCLRSIAAAAGVPLDYDDLCAALGVSFAAVSSVSDSSPSWWMTFGRDAFLTPAARLFGLSLRDLQPPDVGVEMAGADEFSQHFELSYKPLIRAALRNGQPVLAWQGWGDEGWPLWGVITAEQGDTFEGVTLWSGGRSLTLTRPALQCYVVEEADPFAPNRTALLTTALTHADAYMNRAPFQPTLPEAGAAPIVTGPAAFDAWEAWVSSGAAEFAWNEHRQHAEFVAGARESAARFLGGMRPIIPEAARDTLEQAIACCESIAQRLAASRDPQTAPALLAGTQARERMREVLTAAEADDRRLAMHIEELLRLC